MLPDYHIHTHCCGHAQCCAGDYAMRAATAGLEEIGFADHLPNFYLPAESRYAFLHRPLTDVHTYLEDVARARRLTPDLAIRVGVEVDYLPGQELAIQSALDGLPLDFVIGSVHFVGSWSLYDPEYYQCVAPGQIWRDYLQTVDLAVSCGLFDVIGHFDVPKLYCPPPPDLADLVWPVLSSLASADICLEVNCAGLRAGLGEPFPAYWVIQRCQEMGVPLILGSDAHRPAHVGSGFVDAQACLQSMGPMQIASFEGRRRRLTTLAGSIRSQGRTHLSGV